MLPGERAHRLIGECVTSWTRELLCSPGIILVWVWDRPGALLKESSTSQFSMGFGKAYLLTNPFFPQERLTGLFG